MTNQECMTIDFEVTLQGDSIDAMTLPARLDDADQPIVPVAVCAQLMDAFGRPVHTYDAVIEPSGAVTLPPVYDTTGIRAGMYSYAAQYTLSNGSTKLLYRGCVPLPAGGAQC